MIHDRQNGFPAHVVTMLHTMRKAQSFSVRPTSDNRLLIQSDKSIGIFDFRTGKGVLNTKGCYFPHLSRQLGAFDYTYPAEFVAECLTACPGLDSETRVAAGIFANTVQIIG